MIHQVLVCRQIKVECALLKHHAKPLQSGSRFAPDIMPKHPDQSPRRCCRAW